MFLSVAVMEITGKYRTPVGVNAHTAFALGYMLASFFSYFLRDWRFFYLGISLTSLPYIAFHFFVSILGLLCGMLELLVGRKFSFIYTAVSFILVVSISNW